MSLSKRPLLFLGAVALTLGSSARAETTNLVLLPSSGNIIGNQTSGSPGFSDQSWQAPGLGKSEFYIAASSLFSHIVTVGDLASMSFWTNKAGGAGAPDWTLYLYTAKTGTDDTGTFYKTRLNSEPYFANAVAPANQWNEWSTGSATPLRFYDQPRAANYGTYLDPTLADLQTGAYLGHNYNAEVITSFSFQTGSGWADGFTGSLDGFSVTLKNGDSASINFQATPEPGTWLLFGTGFSAVILYSRRRRQQV